MSGIQGSSKRWLQLSALVLLASILYQVIDANSTLFLYDLFLTVTKCSRFKGYRGKTVWVTGASSGIGAEVVCQLVEAEAGRLILSSRRADKLNEVAQSCRERARKNGTVISIVPYDAMGSLQDIEAAVHQAVQEGSIDMLILNAGIYHVQPALLTPKHVDRQVMRVNYESAVELFRALIRVDKWKERGYGHVLAVSSVAGRIYFGGISSYIVSKHAMKAYFNTVAVEESSWLRVDVASLGPVDTDLWKLIGAQPVKRGQMSVKRAVRLIMTGTVGPHILFFDTMIGKADTHIAAWLNCFMPSLYHFLQHYAAQVRLAIWERDRVDEFSLFGIAIGLFQILLGKL